VLKRLNTQFHLSSILAATIILEKIFRNTYVGICTVKDWDKFLDIVGVSLSGGIGFWIAHGAFSLFNG
jgi:hypothetical protein